MIEHEPLLLATIIALSSQFGTRQSNCHEGLAPWIDQQITTLLQGYLEMRTVASVEALLLWAEWPAITISDRSSSVRVPHGAVDKQLADELLQIKQADARSWTYIGRWQRAIVAGLTHIFGLGLGVRLAQELDLQARCFKYAKSENVILNWQQEREIRTWLCVLDASLRMSHS